MCLFLCQHQVIIFTARRLIFQTSTMLILLHCKCHQISCVSAFIGEVYVFCAIKMYPWRLQGVSEDILAHHFQNTLYQKLFYERQCLIYNYSFCQHLTPCVFAISWHQIFTSKRLSSSVAYKRGGNLFCLCWKSVFKMVDLRSDKKLSNFVFIPKRSVFYFKTRKLSNIFTDILFA